ncbi:hypothetical protein HYW32_00025 [Candidatus Berkelbacteria bacterium]|nr:hypothetical protein [Candidatus Berkelbacteria bacterium]
MKFLKKHRNFLSAGILIFLLGILIWPIFSLLTDGKVVFDFQLLVLTIILIALLSGAFLKFIKRGWKDDNLIAVMALFFTILFFVSNAAQKDLETIDALTAVTSYNCTIAKGILDLKDEEWLITYGYYGTDLYLQNLGFAQEKHGHEMGGFVRQLTYNMVYSNRLLDSMIRLNIPTDTPAESKRFIDGMKNQLVILAQEIDDIIKCP